MLPEPTPAPMPRAMGWKMFRLETKPASSEIKIAPISVPVMYSASTPRPSGESMPKRSPMMARPGSRPMEKVAPIASRLMPSISATGMPSATQPIRLPSSCSTRPQPTCASCGSDPPTSKPSLAINKNSAQDSTAAAKFWLYSPSCSGPGRRLRSRPSTRPISSAQIMGSNTTLPTPRAIGSGPSHSDNAAIPSASANTCTTLLIFNAALAGCTSVRIKLPCARRRLPTH